MESIRMLYLGMDVSKATLHVCLHRENTGKAKTKVVENSCAGVHNLLTWLGRQGLVAAEVHVVLEATGVYHECAAEALHESGVRVSIVNPARVRDFARGLAHRTKTDALDAEILARFGTLVQPPPWTPPPLEIRVLRALLARQQAIEEDLRRERNRQEKARATFTPEPVLESIEASVRFLKEARAHVREEITRHLEHCPHLHADVQRLLTIPGVGPQVSRHLLVILHTHRFQRAEQVGAYLGLVPIERQSGTSVCARARLSKNGPSRIRAMLYMAAITAVRYNPHVRACYERLLARGKAPKAALGAAMRKLVHLCFGIFKNQCAYRSEYVPGT